MTAKEINQRRSNLLAQAMEALQGAEQYTLYGQDNLNDKIKDLRKEVNRAFKWSMDYTLDRKPTVSHKGEK